MQKLWESEIFGDAMAGFSPGPFSVLGAGLCARPVCDKDRGKEYTEQPRSLWEGTIHWLAYTEKDLKRDIGSRRLQKLPFLSLQTEKPLSPLAEKNIWPNVATILFQDFLFPIITAFFPRQRNPIPIQKTAFYRFRLVSGFCGEKQLLMSICGPFLY